MGWIPDNQPKKPYDLNPMQYPGGGQNYDTGYTPTPGAGGSQNMFGVGSKYQNPQTGAWGTITGTAEVPTYTYPEQFGANAGTTGIRTAPKPGMVWTGVGWEDDPYFSGPEGSELTQLPGGGWGWVSYGQPTTAPATAPTGEADFTYDQGQDQWEKIKGWFDQPTTAEQAYGEIDWNQEPFISTYGKPKLGELDQPTNLERMLPGFEGMMPNLVENPGLGPYYEDAKRRAQQSIDNWAASRGAYGSSAALTLGADEIARLEGERALNEAQYALDRSAEQRGWISDLSDIGGQADIERGRRWESQTGYARDISDAEWNQNMDKMAMSLGVDASMLSKMVAGMTAATGAENLSNQEKMQMLQSIWAPLSAILPMVLNTYGGVIGGAEEGLTTEQALELKRLAAEMNLDDRQTDMMMGGINTVLRAYSTLKGGGSTGGAY